MEKTTTMNLRVNPLIKQQAEGVLKQLGVSMSSAVDIYLRQIALTGGIPFPVSLPKAPASINADLMAEEDLHRELLSGYQDMESGRIREASAAFDEFLATHL